MRRKFYYSNQSPPALIGGRPPRATLGLLIAFGVVFFLMVFSGSEKLSYYSALSFPLVNQGEIWRLITAPFFFGLPHRIEVLSALGSGVVIWAFGSLMERWWGGKRMLVFLFTCTFAGHVVSGLIGWAVWPLVLVGGIAPGATALALAAALIFRDRGLGLKFRGQIYGLEWWIILLVIGGIVGLGALVDLVEGRPIVSQIGELAAAGVAYLFVTEGWRPWVRRRRKQINGVQEEVNKVLQFPTDRLGGSTKGRRDGKKSHKDNPHRWN